MQLLFVLMSLLVITGVGGPVLAASTAPRLVIDSRNVARTNNLKMVLGKVVKCAANPLIVQDKPWELRTDNMYPNVLYDEEEGIFKLWYTPFVAFPEKRECALCYATSTDGLNWKKPDLEICSYKGIHRTNILSRMVHGAGVIKDSHESDPDKRYKMLYLVDTNYKEALTQEVLDNLEPGRARPESWGLYVAFSRDGIHWRHPDGGPVITYGNLAIGDTHNNFQWVQSLGCYVAITRMWQDNPRARLVARMTSADFTHWTEPKVVFRAPESETPKRQFYSMPTFPYGGGYVGLVSVIHDPPNDDTVDVELAWSPDTEHWSSICPGQPFIQRGDTDSFDSHIIYAGWPPIVKDGRIWLYYAGCSGKHGGTRQTGFGLAYLRKDGFAALEAPKDKPGRMETPTILCDGRELKVNADCGGGWLKVEVLDATGEVIPGLDLGSCNPVSGDSEDHTVSWKNKMDLSKVAGQSITLRFELQGARLYSFRLR